MQGPRITTGDPERGEYFAIAEASHASGALRQAEYLPRSYAASESAGSSGVWPQCPLVELQRVAALHDFGRSDLGPTTEKRHEARRAVLGSTPAKPTFGVEIADVVGTVLPAAQREVNKIVGCADSLFGQGVRERLEAGSDHLVVDSGRHR